jgi:hypothetical protein
LKHSHIFLPCLFSLVGLYFEVIDASAYPDQKQHEVDKKLHALQASIDEEYLKAFHLFSNKAYSDCKQYLEEGRRNA